MGQNLELDVKMPTGVEGCEVSGKLGGQLQWSFARGKVSKDLHGVFTHLTRNIPSHVQHFSLCLGVCVKQYI